MSDILEKRRRQREEWLTVARTYAEALRQKLGPLTAVVYGSVARGDFHLGSDVDLLIISEGLPDNPLVRMELLYAEVEPPLEPKGYIPAEFHALLARNQPAIREAWERGIVVIDDLELWKRIG